MREDPGGANPKTWLLPGTLGLFQSVHKESLRRNPDDAVGCSIDSTCKGSNIATPAGFNIATINLNGRGSQEPVSLSRCFILNLDRFDVRLHMHLSHGVSDKTLRCFAVRPTFEGHAANVHGLNLINRFTTVHQSTHERAPWGLPPPGAGNPFGRRPRALFPSTGPFPVASLGSRRVLLDIMIVK